MAALPQDRSHLVVCCSGAEEQFPKEKRVKYELKNGRVGGKVQRAGREGGNGVEGSACCLT